VYTSPLSKKAHQDGCNTNMKSYITTSNQVAGATWAITYKQSMQNIMKSSYHITFMFKKLYIYIYILRIKTWKGTLFFRKRFLKILRVIVLILDYMYKYNLLKKYIKLKKQKKNLNHMVNP